MGGAGFTVAARLDDELRRWLRCEESLLVEMALTHHGYGVRLGFNLTWASEGVLRPDLDSREQRLTIEMRGVQRLHMEGGLSQRMLDYPEAINWGLSEVSLLRAEPCAAGLQLQVLWEGERRIVIDAQSASVIGPDGVPSLP
ncbi:hypothetical protein DJ010_11770 [Nocardioides silvaticus]|uniref:Uncharacterized protein n=1 Tax=Nocardioides silvaticus TaxID=2201891 RepID=A0A316TIJ1_9ACTN|nr:hypothetical protein [Nocardioides silvaticus]PWN03039.1 hypothetical protein DJ010_11770 [Nocardioides silvaticus]